MSSKVECPKCKGPMKPGSTIGPVILYNCDKCGIDGYRPDVKKKTKEVKKTSRNEKADDSLPDNKSEEQSS